MTASERKADAIAKQLVKVLNSIEKFDDDPAMITDAAEVIGNSSSKGVKEAVKALRDHYSDGHGHTSEAA